MSEIQTYRVFAGPMFVGRLHVNHAPLNTMQPEAYHLFIDREGRPREGYGPIPKVLDYRNLQLKRIDCLAGWN